MKKDKPDEMTLAKDKVKLEKPKKERTRKGPLKKDPPKQGRTSKNALNTEKPKKVKASKNAFGTERPKKERTSKETPDKGRVNEGRPAKDAANSDDARKVRVRETLSYIDQPKKKRLKRENFLDNPRGGRWKKAGILTTVFVLAILISSLVLNQGTSDITVGLSDPDLPRVAFEVRNQRVNALEGYVDEMDITAMRDTITPISDNGLLNMYLETGGQEITGIRYEVYSLNGEEVYLQNAVKELSEDQVTLELGNALPEGIQEAVLRVALRVGSDEEKEIFYYTRIERQDELSVKECMDFAKDFHETTFTRDKNDEIAWYLEPDETADNTTLQTVNIHSNLFHVCWGDLAPEVSTEVEWSIKESNTVYTSLLAKYQVTAVGDREETETYNVREFFRVRCSGGEMYLLDYNRTMNEVFNGDLKIVDKDGIVLGLSESEVAYEANAKGTVVSFVQDRDLWTYNRKKNELSLVFSFANMEGYDVRSRNDEHQIRIISVDNSGNTTFAVYGYMNRGEHEGQVGVDVYYFDIAKNAVQEKAFIPSTKAFAIAEDELGKMVYFNQEQQLLYVLAGGVLYQVDLEKNDQEILAENLEEGQYVVSDDGHLMAFQPEGELNTAQEVCVLNLANGESYTVNASREEEGTEDTGWHFAGFGRRDDKDETPAEAVRPLGFVYNDFVCGYLRTEDQGTTVAGDAISPMYELEIRDTSNKIKKNYKQDGIFISDVLIEKGFMTVNRLSKNEGVYTGIAQDYVTNNEERKESKVTAEAFSTVLKEKQMRLTFADEIEEFSPKILRPKKVMETQPITISFDDKVKTDKFYVYGVGKLAAVYDKAAYAIQKAEQISGVVISSEQSYIWEKGNRDLVYYTEAAAFQKAEGQSSTEACMQYLEEYAAQYMPGAKRIDLTGCTLNQVLYIISKGMPVIMMTDPGHAVLLTGYDYDTVTYMDPDNGQELTVSMEQMDAVAAGGGNTFIGFVK
ncbi:hypothetical protein D3Z53_15835 [Lachnospiraceae bacterium]|jgi:hypothetical protein|nr:C39 family peptidase [uncultured Schaedlerella sp.]NBI59496.1 hypothetical protein [Lachnospiraceae bacterium]